MPRYAGDCSEYDDYSDGYFAERKEIERLERINAKLLAACEQAKTLLDALRLDNGVGHLLSATQKRTYRAVDEQIQAALAAAKGE